MASLGHFPGAGHHPRKQEIAMLRLIGEFHPPVSRALVAVISIEQNFGPHMEQECASLCAALGSVSS
jgi:hypothetical protein